MNVDDRLPLFVGHLLNDAVPSIAGIVHDDVQPAKTVHARLDETFGETVFCHAAGADHGLAANRTNGLGGLIGRVGIQIVDHHARPFRGQLERDLATDTPARTGNQRNAPVKFSSHVFSSRLVLSRFFIKRGHTSSAETQIMLERQPRAIDLPGVGLPAQLLD